MRETVLGLFRFPADAEMALRDLRSQGGVPQPSIRVIGPGCTAAPLAVGLMRMGFGRRTAEHYAEAVRRGAVLVGIKADGRRADRAASIMQRRNAETIVKAPTRRAGTDPGRPFEAGTMEMTETAQEAVVSKVPRVVEEIVVHKDVADRVHPVRDTLKRTEVGVRRMAAVSSQGESAYEVGSRYAALPDWPAAEAEARREWEARGRDDWDDVKVEVREGWERARR